MESDCCNANDANDSSNKLTADGSYIIPFLAIAKAHSFQVETSNANSHDKAYQANGSCRLQQNGYIN